jgi:hypothetical protein
MPKLISMREAIAELVPDGASVALGLQMEQMIPFAAGHEVGAWRSGPPRLCESAGRVSNGAAGSEAARVCGTDRLRILSDC